LLILSRTIQLVCSAYIERRALGDEHDRIRGGGVFTKLCGDAGKKFGDDVGEGPASTDERGFVLSDFTLWVPRKEEGQ
jgi:hypothetical protein